MGYGTRLKQNIRPEHAARARAVRTTDASPAPTAAPSPLITLQHRIGNRAVGRLVQTRLKVADPGDRFEREADRVANQAKGHSGMVPDVSPELDQRIRAHAGGEPLPEPARAFFESRFGWDFGGVRVHTGAAAAATARRLRASAFATGRDIVFGAGEYAPATTAGRSLLAHELAHVIQQASGRVAPQASAARAEREADAAAAARGPVPLSGRPVAVHRQPAPARTGLTRDELAKGLRAIFGHDVTIAVGDKERQTRELGGPRDRRRLPDDWKAWDPGASSPLYDEILGAIQDFGREVGGVPDIGQVVFYDVRYDYDDQGNVVAYPNAAAEINRRRGVMFVYRAALFETDVAAGGRGFTSSGVFFASKRSTPGSRGASAPMGAATRTESQRRTIAHELGHGVERATRSLAAFEQAVGWVNVGGELRLYDIQARGVKAAIARGAEPPAAARITRGNWNSGTHLEQPLREYAVTDSSEDYADSLMAWLYARDLLKARSPARFKFFDDQARRKGWLPKLVSGGARAAPTQGSP